MNFLIKFAQMHLSFRRAEIESLAIVESVDLTIIEYTDDVRSYDMKLHQRNVVVFLYLIIRI